MHVHKNALIKALTNSRVWSIQGPYIILYFASLTSVCELGIESEVDVMEDWVRVGGLLDNGDFVNFLLDIDNCLCAGGDEWDFLLNKVLFEFPEGKLFN